MFLEEYVEIINNKLKGINYYKNVVFWGVSDFGEKVLRYSNLNMECIKYYIDSNLAGDLFFGHKILSPNEILWHEIDCVIITAYYSQKVIQEILLKQYQYAGKIIIIDEGEIEPFYKYTSLRDYKSNNFGGILQKNVELKNAHYGRRCFILGNGPSTKEYDFSKISNEIVFCVNNFYHFDDDIKKQINPQYLVTADPAYFEDTIYWKQERKNLAEVTILCPNVKYLFPVSGKRVVDSEEQFDKKNIYYFESMNTDKVLGGNVIDLTQKIPYIQATVHACIYWAIYMGIKEIYLLGCEETSIFNNLKFFLNENSNAYAYDMNEGELNGLKDEVNRMTVEYMCIGQGIIYKNYKIVEEVCKANEVTIYTCAEKTLVKNLKYIPYSFLFE